MSKQCIGPCRGTHILQAGQGIWQLEYKRVETVDLILVIVFLLLSGMGLCGPLG